MTDLHEAERLIERRAFRDAHRLCLEALADDPACAEAFFLLAMIAGEHDNFVRAAQLLDRAIDLNGAAARYHAQRGKCLMRLGRAADACAAAEAAAALAPDDALTLDTIGVIHSHAGFHERAISFFERAAERDRSNANIMHNLGVSRQFSGDLHGAEAAFRAELELRPEARRPYASIVQLSTQTRESNLLPQLEAQFAAASDTNERLSIAHALAKTCEDLGEYERSLDWLKRGKEPKRAELGDVMSEFVQTFAAAAAHAQTPAAARAYASDEPIFIFGMPRTGTTLVDRILSSHPDVISAGELGNFSALARLLAESPEAPAQDLYLRADRIDFARLGRLYVESTRPRTGATRRFIDKMPVNFLNAALVHRALPQARMICLRRDPMDACLSNYRQLFGADAAPYFYTFTFEDLARYYRLFDELGALWRALLPSDRYLEVDYEAIVADLEGQTRRMLDFCALPWDPNCLDFHTNAAPVATASSAQVRSPIYSSSVGRWRRYGQALAPLHAALKAEGLEVG